MSAVTVDFNRIVGKIKPMHAVNNGPQKAGSDQTRGNMDTWIKAGIPYARNHDASFCAAYGGEHTVDIHSIFPDFNADVNDPASYDFLLTDGYCRTIQEGNTKVFYRLGSKIEHWAKKYGTLPPADFQKWAEICEHIIMHYTEGWADGFWWDIAYWEIWNEPDLDPDDSLNKRTWGGTEAEFFELYRLTACHLKKRFPHLKIGGPAVAYDMEWTERFFAAMSKAEVPIDFFSWHCYLTDPKEMIARENQVHILLEKYGYADAESICNEWNYVKNWDTLFVYSIEQIISMKGAALNAACMLACQQSTMDMLMYYDARIDTCFNGLFDFYTLRPLKGYYGICMFNELYKMGQSAVCEIEGEQLYAAAACSEDGSSAVMICYYTDDDREKNNKTVKLHVSGGADCYEVILLDKDHNMEENGSVNSKDQIEMRPNSVVLLRAGM